AWLERNLLERSKPRWNRTRGVESAMCIRVRHTAGAPQLTTVYWPVVTDTGPDCHLYGPYLGGNQARLAVSAFDRVLPVRYTHDLLTGSQRDMARARGVEPHHRDALLTTLMDALGGDPVALGWVRDNLAVHRDRAAEREAYELAGRIQQEIEAIEWI